MKRFLFALALLFPGIVSAEPSLGPCGQFDLTCAFPGLRVGPIRVVTSAGVVTASPLDYVISINKTSGAATTVNLFATPAIGAVIFVKDDKGDAATNNITITPASGNIDGLGTYVISTNRGAAQLIYDGTQWEVSAPLGNTASGSGAEQTISFQPGLLTAVTNTKGVFGKFVKASTVDNLIASAINFTCVGNPTITLYECGTDASCATSPTTIGTATVTAAGSAVTGAVSAPAITAGDFVAWAISAGTCTSLDIAANAQVHAN